MPPISSSRLSLMTDSLTTSEYGWLASRRTSICAIIADGELGDALPVHDDRVYLIPRQDLIVYILEDLLGGEVRCRVGMLEDLLVVPLQHVVHGLDALGGYDLDDVPRDGLARLDEAFSRLMPWRWYRRYRLLAMPWTAPRSIPLSP